MIKPLTMFVVLSAACASTFAAPTVTGNTISWPDDGWYQVQSADGSTSICEGGNGCEVSPGSYIVINHTTGERFTDIVVGSTPAVTNIVVTGNTIFWPDDGWYQVQSSDGDMSVCEGGSSCEVSAGSYIVINHTTGERFPDIVVGSTPGVTSIVVTGNTISWPDDGWYQVQSADGSMSVCEGGSSCEVSDGVYVVINHHTGERFDGIVVGDGLLTPSDLPDEVARGTDRVFEILNGDAIEVMEAVRIQLSQAEERGFELLSTSFNFEISNNVDLFACPGGGTVGNAFQEISGGSTRSTNLVDACSFAGIVVSGRFVHTTSFGRGAFEGIFDNSTYVSNYHLERSGSADVTVMDSGRLRVRGRFDTGIFSEQKMLTELIYTSSEESYSVELAEITISDSIVPIDSMDDGNGISILIESLNDTSLSGALTVSTEQPLQFTTGISDPNPISGVFSVVGQDSTWQVDADGGDVDSVLITVTTMGSTTGYQQPRSSYSLDFVDPSSVSIEP